MNIKIKIDGLEKLSSGGSQKYIVGRDGQNLSLYSVKENRHAKVAERFGLDDESVLGGGSISFCDSSVTFQDFSADYGAVPQEVVEKFYASLEKELSRVGVESVEFEYYSDGLIFHPSSDYLE